ncbi:DUF1684 domain-containing protein [soil metagenome]
MSGEAAAEGTVTLLDWRRQVFELYADVRRAADPESGWIRWRAKRDELFARHPQSPIPESDRAGWDGLGFFDYDASRRVLASLEPAAPDHYEIGTSGEETMGFTRCAQVRFELDGRALSLEAYWLDGYGGGLFLPFRDLTSGDQTYGAGRYLLDTVKGADLGMDGERLVADFNFAYNPSCSYDPRWVCPLAPPPNRLDVAVEAGERTP